MINKNKLAPDNLVIGANRELKLLEILENTVIGVDSLNGKYEVVFSDLKDSPITIDWLSAQGFTQRSLTTHRGKIIDFIKQETTETGTITISVLQSSQFASSWSLEIKDKDFKSLCQGDGITSKHVLQNLISAYV